MTVYSSSVVSSSYCIALILACYVKSVCVSIVEPHVIVPCVFIYIHTINCAVENGSIESVL